MFSVLRTAGSQCLLQIISAYGVFHSELVCTSRKAVTISLSFILFPKPLTLGFVLACLLVFSGLAVGLHRVRTAAAHTQYQPSQASSPIEHKNKE